jgi:hypothetical protein
MIETLIIFAALVLLLIAVIATRGLIIVIPVLFMIAAGLANGKSPVEVYKHLTEPQKSKYTGKVKAGKMIPDKAKRDYVYDPDDF